MMIRNFLHAAVGCLVGTLLPALLLSGRAWGADVPLAPNENFSYAIEWRLITAGVAKLSAASHASGVNAHVQLWSTGLVSRLFKINDNYTVRMNDKFCASDVKLLAEEGSKRRDTTITWRDLKSHYIERDLNKNNQVVLDKKLDTPACVHDIIGAMRTLRATLPQPGQTMYLPISDGKKLVNGKIEAQLREEIKTPAGRFQAIRYEANLFNDVLFKRDARLFVWISDDNRRLPVQVQVKMRFHIGTVTFLLDKYEDASQNKAEGAQPAANPPVGNQRAGLQ